MLHPFPTASEHTDLVKDEAYFQARPPAKLWGNSLAEVCHQSGLILSCISGEWGGGAGGSESFVSSVERENRSRKTTLYMPFLSTMEYPVPLPPSLLAWKGPPGPGVAGPVGSKLEFPRDKALIHQLSPDIAAPSRFLGGQ